MSRNPVVVSDVFTSEFEIVTAPSGDVVTLSDLKSHLKYESSDQDDYIESLRDVAVDAIERDLRCQLLTATWDVYFDQFPFVSTFTGVDYGSDYGIPRGLEHRTSWLSIRKAPVSSITSIVYTDVDGTSRTLSTDIYTLNNKRTPARVTLKHLKSWPSTRAIEQAVRVRFVAGYGTAADVPAAIKHAIKLKVDGLFNGIEDRLQKPINDLLEPYRWGL